MRNPGIGFGGLLAVTIILIGCGSDDSPNQGTDRPSGPTESGYIERADAICARANAQFEETAQRISEEKAKRDAKIAVQRAGIRRTERAVADIRKLEPPIEDADSIDDWLSMIERSVPLGHRLVRAAETRSDQLEELGKRAEAVTARSQSFAHEYGFQVCG